MQKEIKLISYEFGRSFETGNNSWELGRSVDALLKWTYVGCSTFQSQIIKEVELNLDLSGVLFFWGEGWCSEPFTTCFLSITRVLILRVMGKGRKQQGGCAWSLCQEKGFLLEQVGTQVSLCSHTVPGTTGCLYSKFSSCFSNFMLGFNRIWLLMHTEV